MKYITTIALALAFSVSMAVAGEKTLTGKVVCAKCTAKKAKKCSPAFVSKGKDGKEVTLLVAGKAAKSEDNWKRPDSGPPAPTTHWFPIDPGFRQS